MAPALRSMASNDIDSKAIAMEWAICNHDALHASVWTRKSGLIKPDKVVDIQFKDFMHDQVGEVKRVYQTFGMPFTDTLTGKIHAYINANPHDKHGAHKHRFEDCGLNYEEERGRVKEYQAYFNVASEF